jgi:tRNA-uridine 2-sulfurtransferase
MSKERVVVAMSGGVDSALAAARLVDEGYDVVGVTLHLWDYPDRGQKGRCCAPEDQYDARRVADHLGIPHYTFDRRELFAREVVRGFVDAYLEGQTPSPCVSCNRTVKLRELLPIADRLGARFVATGHYARVVRHGDATYLARGADPQKDQAYFLYMLRPDELERLLLPLGPSLKPEVRAEALARGLPGADKGESQELCFVGDEGYAEFVARRADGRVRPGRILGPAGEVVGQHDGLHRFTIGQRKGLGVALGQPAFVVALDANDGSVRLGSEAELTASGARLGSDFTLTYPEREEELPLHAVIQVRARHVGAAGRCHRDSSGAALVSFDEPVRAVSPGQVAVLYADDGRVLGGGTIEASISSASDDVELRTRTTSSNVRVADGERLA